MPTGMRRAATTIGAGVLALVASWSAPAAAPRTITAPDGTLVSVWEVGVRGQVDDPETPGGSALAYSLTDGSGTRTGIVAPTADQAADGQPDLAVDPRTGAVVLVWSRADAVYRKIAYARLEQGGWTDFHLLTFDGGDDVAPRIGSSSAGSYLFWAGPGSSYFYAPVELSAGRLLAAPRALALGFLRSSGRRGADDTGVSTGPGAAQGGIRGGGQARLAWRPRDLTPQGGTDSPGGPPKHSKPNNASTWGVGSSPGCGRVILVLPDAASDVAHIVAFHNGATTEIGRAPIPTAAPDDFGDALAASRLDPACR